MPDNPPDTALPPVKARLPLLTELWDLFLMEMTNWRWTWRGMLITGTLAPLVSIAGLGIFARDSGPAALAYVLTGNLVVSLLFGSMHSLESHITFMRFLGAMDYYATLPIRRVLLVVAMLMSFVLLGLPSLLVTVLAGSALLGVPLHPSPLLLLALPLCALPLAGVGALIGLLARTPHEGDAVNMVVMFILLGLGPVLIPPERLPAIFNALGWLSPATYAASALRQTVLGPLSPRLLLDLGMLLAFSAASFTLVNRKIHWSATP